MHALSKQASINSKLVYIAAAMRGFERGMYHIAIFIWVKLYNIVSIIIIEA